MLRTGYVPHVSGCKVQARAITIILTASKVCSGVDLFCSIRFGLRRGEPQTIITALHDSRTVLILIKVLVTVFWFGLLLFPAGAKVPRVRAWSASPLLSCCLSCRLDQV